MLTIFFSSSSFIKKKLRKQLGLTLKFNQDSLMFSKMSNIVGLGLVCSKLKDLLRLSQWVSISFKSTLFSKSLDAYLDNSLIITM